MKVKIKAIFMPVMIVGYKPNNGKMYICIKSANTKPLPTSINACTKFHTFPHIHY